LIMSEFINNNDAGGRACQVESDQGNQCDH